MLDSSSHVKDPKSDSNACHVGPPRFHPSGCGRPLSFSSSFLLALSIISSLRLFSRACLSFLLLLHVCVCDGPGLPLGPLPSEGAEGGDDTFDPRLYRVIRSMCSDLVCPEIVLAVIGVAPAGMVG